MRVAVHQARAAALSQLLRCDPPSPGEREIPCRCGHQARYREMRSRHVLTAVGEIEFLRPWYLCPQCHHGQSPADAALDIEKADLSPGVRRMLALVGSEAPFQHGRQQMEVLAGLAVTAKAVERTWRQTRRTRAAPAIGGWSWSNSRSAVPSATWKSTGKLLYNPRCFQTQARVVAPR